MEVLVTMMNEKNLSTQKTTCSMKTFYNFKNQLKPTSISDMHFYIFFKARNQ